jgi:hypothetical protein
MTEENKKWVEKAEFFAKICTKLPKIMENYALKKKEIDEKKKHLFQTNEKINEENNNFFKIMKKITHFIDHIFGIISFLFGKNDFFFKRNRKKFDFCQ